METRPQDLPPLLWLYFPPWAALAVLAANAFEWHDICFIIISRDVAGGGVLEWGTPLILLPGIIAGVLALKRFAGHRRRRWIRAWVAMWALACFYFAGEEISWGQWLFGWETPEFFLDGNKQGETNFHNMSNLLNHTPRTFVVVFMFFCGLLLPLWRLITGRVLDVAKAWAWLLPTHVGMVAAGCWSAAKIIDWGNDLTTWLGAGMTCRFDDSEIREFYIAVFLSLYLLSIWRRAGQTRRDAVGSS